MSSVQDLVEIADSNSSESKFSTYQPAFPQPPSNSISKPLSCDVCQKTFDKLSLLVTHIVVYHGRDEDNADQGKLDVPRILRRGRRSGRSTQSNLYMVHKFFATNKPFSCEVCTRCFAYKYQLIDHLNTHVKEQKFCCNICKREFVVKEDLVTHLRAKAYDPSACDLCGQKFPSWSALSNHRLQHFS